MRLIVLLALLLLALLLAYPYTISLPTSELVRGQTYTATISAPAGASVALSTPQGIVARPAVYLGADTWTAVLVVAPGAPLDRRPRQVVLLIDGRPVASASVRIWTDAVVVWRVWVPIIKSP